MVNKFEFINIPIQEVQRYLGFPQDAINDSFMDQINEVIYEIKTEAEPKYIYQIYPISIDSKENQIIIGGTTLSFTSHDLAIHLKNATEVAIIAVTLGYKIDRLIAFYSKTDMTRALIFDAVGSAYIDTIAEQIEQTIKEQTIRKETQLITRFSPGYGDLSIDLQDSILLILDAPKKIGLYSNPDHILIPLKSITAFLGLINEDSQSKISEKFFEIPKNFIIPNDCRSCLQFQQCIFLKKGDYCEFRRKTLKNK